MIAGAIDLAYCCGVPAKLILISYPASVTWFLSAGSSRFYIERLCAIMKPRAVGPPPPILFIYGTCDQFTGSRAYERWLKRIQSSLDAGQTNPMEVKRVEAANHFWFHDEQKVVDLIQHWIHSTGS
jgi:alpha/beta superfamily hydrolase